MCLALKRRYAVTIPTLLKMEFEGGGVVLKFHFKIQFLQSCFLNDQYSLSHQIASMHPLAKARHGPTCRSETTVAVLTTTSSQCLRRLGRKLAIGRLVTSFSVTLSAFQKPFHGRCWRQMPLMLFSVEDNARARIPINNAPL